MTHDNIYLSDPQNQTFACLELRGRQRPLLTLVCFPAARNKLFLKQIIINEVHCEPLGNKILKHSF